MERYNINRLKSLAGLITENKKPQLLKECFLPYQVKYLFDTLPEITNILKKDPLFKKASTATIGKDGNEYSGAFYSKDGSLEDNFAYYAGCDFDLGPEDFNLKSMILIFKEMVEMEELTKDSYNKVIPILKKFNFKSKSLKWYAEKEYERLKKLGYEDIENWYSYNKKFMK